MTLNLLLGTQKYRTYFFIFLLFSLAGTLAPLSFADFTDITSSAGVAYTGSGRGVAWGDYDNDGDLDLYLANAGPANRLYRNNGNSTFTDIASSAGISDTGSGIGVAWGDYDNDGDLDLYLANYGQANRLYRNNQNNQNFLFVRPLNAVGRFNRHGAVVRVFQAGTTTLVGMRTIDGGSSYASQNAYDAHFGLPSGGTYDIKVTFPGGTVVDKNVNPLLGNVSPTNIPQGYVEVRQNGDVSLPVTLSSFTATTSAEGITLHWRTESEVNNIGFSIYRSEEENGNYTRLAFVSGAGNSVMPTDYQFTDKKAEAGKTYFYYLEDIDIAGEKSKSKIIKVVVPAKPVILIPDAPEATGEAGEEVSENQNIRENRINLKSVIWSHNNSIGAG